MTTDTSTPAPVPPPFDPPAFDVVAGRAVAEVLAGREKEVVDIVEATYRLHGEAHTVNPPSYFLRFPDRPEARIIALPASVGADVDTAGLKWIASFPRNVAAGLPRASAVLLLNDRATGYPFACLESSIISAARTAASAALAAGVLGRGRERLGRVGFVGTGLIARYIHTYLAAQHWPFEEIVVHDLAADRVRGFGSYLEGVTDVPVRAARDAEDLVRSCDVVVYATTAGTPHVTDPGWFAHHPLVLHVSLRDLAPEILMDAVNVLDDVEHCLKADTSPYLVEQLTGGREFVDAVLYDALTGSFTAPADRTVIFSPFGLGVLDIAVGAFVHAQARAAGLAVPIDGFFSELATHGSTAVPS